MFSGFLHELFVVFPRRVSDAFYERPKLMHGTAALATLAVAVATILKA